MQGYPQSVKIQGRGERYKTKSILSVTMWNSRRIWKFMIPIWMTIFPARGLTDLPLNA